MPDVLADPPYSLYVLLILAGLFPLGLALFFGGSGSDRQKRSGISRRTAFLIASGVAFALLLGLFLCDRFFESDKEQIFRKMTEMSDGVRERNLNRTFSHVSETFQLGGVNKARLRQLAETAQQSNQVDEIPLTLDRLDPITDGKNATVYFMFKLRGSQGEMPYRGKGYFVKDPDHQWRLQRFEIFNFAGDMNTPIGIPGI